MVAEPSAAWTGAAVQETSAAVEVPAVKACPAVADSAAGHVAAEVSEVVVAAAEGGNHVTI